MNKPIVYSYTLLRNFENCPYKCYRLNVLKDIKFKSTPEMDWGNEVHDALDRRISKNRILPANMGAYEPYAAYFQQFRPSAEMKVGITREGAACDFFAPNVFLRGKIDLSWGDQVKNVGWIVDYKTGKRREDDLELELFGLMFAAHTQGKYQKILGRYLWLKTFEIGSLHDLSNVTGTFNYVQKTVAEIEHNAAAGYWPKKQNPLCGWCDVLDCEFNKKGK